jgi:nucleoside-diphosphate-sugar epimerase
MRDEVRTKATGAVSACEGLSILVTGASRGIGRTVAEGLAAAGANVTLAARPGPQPVRRLLHRPGRRPSHARARRVIVFTSSTFATWRSRCAPPTRSARRASRTWRANLRADHEQPRQRDALLYAAG